MLRLALPLVLLVGCDSTTEAPQLKKRAPPAALAWSDVGSQPELAELAATALAANKGLMLDVRADWCVPCVELEHKTFSDPKVQQALAESFIAVRLDVTESSPAAESLQGMVGSSSMPWVVFWPMTAQEAATFAAGSVPPPSKTISTYVSAQELLPTLSELAAR